jgi:F-type H+-transporting ATPase subunit delta|tara:strand:- start:5182 stop:5724 length:543 start_codon:yes stop_codon:yes gene_type:complete
MSNKIIAKRYAIALFNTVQNDDLDSLFADTQELLNTIHSSDDLMNVLKSPITKGEHKLNIISSLIKDAQSGKILKGLLNTLYKNKRLSLLALTLSCFSDVLLLKRGYQSANVTTVSKIDEDTKKNISDLLNSQYGSKINIEFKTNQSLLGGMTVVVGSKMIDLSLRSQVSKFTNNVKGDI